MFLALKEMKHAKLRFTMIGAIIVLIAWLVFILSGLGNGLSTLSAATMKNMDAQYFVFEEGSSATLSKSSISASLEDKLKEVDNVKGTATFGSALGAISKEKTNKSEEKTDVAILGVKPGSFLEPKVIEGSQLNPTIKNGVLANETLKEKGYKIGDEMIVDSSTVTLKIVGFVENETHNHLPSLFVTLDQWRAYQYAAPGSNNGIEDVVNTIALQGEEIDPAQVNSSIDGIETVTKKEAINGMPGYVEENGTIVMMLSFLVVISAFVIAVFFYVLTIQKTQQFGVMKAIGANNSFIAKAIVSQVFVLSFISIAIGIGLTYLTAMVFPEKMPFNLDIKIVLIYAVVLLIISVLSSLISVRRITKVDPLTALGRVE